MNVAWIRTKSVHDAHRDMARRLGCWLCILVVISLLTVGLAGAGMVQADERTNEEQNEFVTVTTTTTHPDLDNQGILVEIKVEPTDDRITDVEVQIFDGTAGFVDFDTFSISLNPSGASPFEEDLGFTGQSTVKTYEIEELEPGESVTISYVAYPREIASETVGVSLVQYEYVRQGQRIPEDPPGTIPARADLSESAFFELQDARSTIDSLEKQISTMWATTIGGAVLGVLGLVAAGILFVKRKSAVQSERERIAKELVDLKSSVDGNIASNRMQKLIDDLRSEGGDDSDGGGGPGI